MTYFYAAGAGSDAIVVLTLDANGTLTPVGTVPDSGAITLDGSSALDTFEIGGTQFLVASGSVDDGITVFSLSDTSPFLTFADRALQTDNAAYNLDNPFDVEFVDTGSGTFIYVSGFNSNGLSVFSVAADGSLTNVQNIDDTDNAAFELDGALGLRQFSRGSTDYLVAAGLFDDGISVFSINSATGALTNVANLGGTSLDGVQYVDAVTIDGRTFIYAGAADADAVDVIEFDGSSLNIVQTLQSSSLLNFSTGAEIIEAGDKLLLAVSSWLSASIEVFEISTDPFGIDTGTLTPLETLNDGSDGALDGSVNARTVVVDGKTFLVSGAGSAINAYEVGGGDDMLDGTREADTMSGGGGDDIIYGFAGNDAIDGGNDDDIMFGGSGSDRFFASLGNDTMDGGSSSDTLDLANVDSSGGGTTSIIDLGFEDATINGVTLNINSIERVQGSMGRDVLRGDAGNNVLSGRAGNDVLQGRAGNDTLNGQAGKDTQTGNSGADTFLFRNVGESVFGSARDVITDFQVGLDIIDLGQIDADTVTGGDQAFAFIGGAGFSNTPGELRISKVGGKTFVNGDVDGDSSVDFQIELNGTLAITGGDFIL